MTNLIEKILAFAKGKKTYACTIAWLVYKVGVAKSYWTANTVLETSLLAGGAMAFRDSLSKPS
jgi:hypothetical protein